MISKKWYLSKTLWLNIVGASIAIIQALQGVVWLDPTLQVSILAILNVVLRLITNTALAK